MIRSKEMFRLSKQKNLINKSVSLLLSMYHLARYCIVFLLLCIQKYITDLVKDSNNEIIMYIVLCFAVYQSCF